jgi:ribosome biogenesis protein ENP2
MASTHAGTLKSTSINGVKLYSLTGNKYVAPWVLAKTKRALRKDKGAGLPSSSFSILAED